MQPAFRTYCHQHPKLAQGLLESTALSSPRSGFRTGPLHNGLGREKQPRLLYSFMAVVTWLLLYLSICLWLMALRNVLGAISPPSFFNTVSSKIINASLQNLICPMRDIDLASENANHYPRQLQQAVALISHLVHSENISSSAITLVGDSAGAHLLLGLILHISHPNPLVPPLQIEGKFSSAVLISPWVDINTSAPSVRENKDKDCLTIESLGYWARNFIGDTASDYWTAPLTAPVEWWRDVPVDEVLVLYGENELIRDDTSTFCETLKVNLNNGRSLPAAI